MYKYKFEWNNISSYVYKRCLEILKNIFQEGPGITDMIINAECNVLHMINILMKSSPSATELKIVQMRIVGWNNTVLPLYYKIKTGFC